MLDTSTARIAQAIKNGAEDVFSRQRPDGAFTFDAPGSTMGTGGAILALHAAAPDDNAALIAGGVGWLLRTRLSDGGWGGVEGAPSEPAPTAIAAAALRAVADPGHAAVRVAIEAAEARLVALGGLEAVGDRVVVQLCRILRAYAGLTDVVPPRRIPLAIVLADRFRRTHVSFRTAPFIGLALLQQAIAPGGGVVGLLNRAAKPKALRLLAAIDEHEGHTGVFSFDPWPAALVLLGLATSGEAPGTAEAIVGYLRRAVRPDGGWDAVTNLDLTRAAFVTTGLAGAGYAADPRLAATRGFFHRMRQQAPFPVFGVPAGGWSFSDAHGWPVVLESAEILHGLSAMPGADDDAEYVSGLAWLAGRQDSAGSWSLWVRDTKLANDGPCPAITAQGVVALAHAGRPDAVHKALRWLTGQQRPDGSFENLWYRGYTSGTAMVLDAFAAAGRRDDPVASLARDWLLRAQQADGSWADGGAGVGTVEETAWAVHALSHFPDDTAGRRGVAWLLDAQRPDGSWPAARVCAYIRGVMHYANPAITAGLALRALGTAQVSAA